MQRCSISVTLEALGPNSFLDPADRVQLQEEPPDVTEGKLLWVLESLYLSGGGVRHAAAAAFALCSGVNAVALLQNASQVQTLLPLRPMNQSD